MQLTFEQIRTYFEHRHPGQRVAAREKVAVRCAFHSEDTPSCTLFLDGNGGFHCHACGAKGNIFQFEARFSACSMDQAEINVAQITGATPEARREGSANLGAPTAVYDYRDENGIVQFQKRRFEPETGAKTFRVFHAENGAWKTGIDAKEGARTRRLLYHLPDVVKANLVFLCEGEKDCDNVMNADLFAKHGFATASTTTYDGAWQKGQTAKWLDSYAPYFTGKQVIIFADNDEPGLVYAETAAAAIKPYAFAVRIVEFPDLPEKADVTDFLAAHTAEELEKRVREAPLWTGKESKRENWLVDAVDWSMTVGPEIEWLVDNVIQVDGNGMIAAEPKTGKSLAALDLLISMSTGLPWLGCAIPRRLRTAYISREDSPVLTKVRVQALLRGKGALYEDRDPSGWLWINTREQLGDFDVDKDEQLANMALDLKERGVEFAIFDVLNRLHNRDENNNTEMGQVVKRIGQMAQDAGCSVGVIHHVSKENGGGRFFSRIRGASAVHGWNEWAIGLMIENPGERRLTRRAEFESKPGEHAPISFTIQSGGGELKLVPIEGGPAAFDPAVHGMPERYGGGYANA
jgi:hypothetical protein